ncbi:SDR family NAD(P)-dependent oxidoreductase [Nocardia sp. NPDC004260]
MVTGAASGLGAALCRLSAARGPAVVAADSDAAGLVGPVADTAIHTRVADVSDDDQMRRLVLGAVAELGRVGGGEHIPLPPWRRLVDVNLWGVVYATRYAYPLTRAQGSGHIVNMTSPAGSTPVAPSAAYAMTEHAVVGLGTALRVEAPAAGVRVSVAVPGGVATGIADSGIDLPGYSYREPLRRMPIGMTGSERAARHILRGMRKNRPHIVFPHSHRAVVAAHRSCPGLMSRLGDRR